MEVKNIFNDATILTEKVLKIKADIKKIQDEIKEKTDPLHEKIRQLEEEFLDKFLIDSTGRPVKKGMTIENGGKRFKVVDRYQQCLIRYLGNPRVSVIPEGKKKAFDIIPRELYDYTIVEQ